MDIKSALDIIRPEEESLVGIKKAYYSLIKQYHPDVNPRGLEFTKTLTEAYECLSKALSEGWLKSPWSAKPGTKSTILNEMEEALEKLKNCKGLEIEICGTWLWIGGNTKYWAKFLGSSKHSNDRKMFTYAPKKVKWFWKPVDYKKRSKDIWSMEQIRNSFGSRKWEENNEERSYVN